MYPNFIGTEAPVLGTLLEITLCISSSGCSSITFMKFFSKVVNISIHLPEFCDMSCSSKLIELEEGLWDTLFQAKEEVCNLESYI